VREATVVDAGYVIDKNEDKRQTAPKVYRIGLTDHRKSLNDATHRVAEK
jgi:hypothetical protein